MVLPRVGRLVRQHREIFGVVVVPVAVAVVHNLTGFQGATELPFSDRPVLVVLLTGALVGAASVPSHHLFTSGGSLRARYRVERATPSN
jgi:hypothetical protein